MDFAVSLVQLQQYLNLVLCLLDLWFRDAGCSIALPVGAGFSELYMVMFEIAASAFINIGRAAAISMCKYVCRSCLSTWFTSW